MGSELARMTRGILLNPLFPAYDNGGRFLQRSSDSSFWSVVSDSRAIGKASQALREGLDVRHKTVRPKKYIPKKTSNKTKKQKNAGKGIVVDTPEIREKFHENLPELIHEQTSHVFEPLFTFFPYNIPNNVSNISEMEYKNAYQI